MIESCLTFEKLWSVLNIIVFIHDLPHALPKQFLISLYKAFTQSYLNYGYTRYNQAFKATMHKLWLVQ